jgi:hypothetical protein
MTRPVDLTGVIVPREPRQPVSRMVVPSHLTTVQLRVSIPSSPTTDCSILGEVNAELSPGERLMLEELLTESPLRPSDGAASTRSYCRLRYASSS